MTLQHGTWAQAAEPAPAAIRWAFAGAPTAWLVAIVAIGIAAWAGQRWRHAAGERDAARTQLHHLGDLLDVWQWRTDPEHRVVSLRPPTGASGDAWRLPNERPKLWELFAAGAEQALRTRMTSIAPLDDLDATRRGSDAAANACRLRGLPLVDASGRFAGYIGTVRERAAAESALPAGADPASAPAPLADPLDVDRDSFGYTVSHDLRAPIRIVEGFTKIVKEDYGRVLDRIGHDHLDRVLGAAARMNNMIDALLALSKLSSRPLAHEPVDLSELARLIADDLRRQSPGRGVVLVVEPGLGAVGDPALLRIVLENLLGNAWKYTANRAVANIAFERCASQPAAFTVRDDGAGFDLRYADRLFSVFQRLHSASEFPGTGIGLASVRRIVRRYGGEIWAEAEPERGARFHFSLPAGERG